MTQLAKGTFQVSLTPAAGSSAHHEEAAIGRLLIDKQFSGDIQGTSQGQMLSHQTAVPGAAGYVAIEQVTGSINGRQGSFCLQHFGTMSPDNSHLTIEVVPHSGTGELANLSGQMTLTIEEGHHFYTLTYEV